MEAVKVALADGSEMRHSSPVHTKKDKWDAVKVKVEDTYVKGADEKSPFSHPAKRPFEAKQRSYKPGQKSDGEEASGASSGVEIKDHNWPARYKFFGEVVPEKKAIPKWQGYDCPKVRKLIDGLPQGSAERNEASNYLKNMIAKKDPNISPFLWEDVILWGVKYNVLGQRNFEKNNLANLFSEYPKVNDVISGIDSPSMRAAAISFATEMINEYDSRLAMYINLFIQHKKTTPSGLLSKAVVGEIQDSSKRNLAENMRMYDIIEYDGIFSRLIRRYILNEKYVEFLLMSRVIPTYPFNGYPKVNKLINEVNIRDSKAEDVFDRAKAIAWAAREIFVRPSAIEIAEWEECVVSLLEREIYDEIPPPPPPPPPAPPVPRERTLNDCEKTKELIDDMEEKKHPFAKNAKSLAASLVTMGLGDHWISDELNRVFVRGTPSLKELQNKKCDDPRFDDALRLARQIFTLIKSRDFNGAEYQLRKLSGLLEELSTSKPMATDDSCFARNYTDFYVHHLLLEIEEGNEKQEEAKELVAAFHKSVDTATIHFKAGEVNEAFKEILHTMTVWYELKGRTDIESAFQRKILEDANKRRERLARVVLDLTSHPRWSETEEIYEGELATFFRNNLVPACLVWIENGEIATYPLQGTLDGMVEKALRVVTRKQKFPYEVPLSSRQNPKKLRCEAETLEHRIRGLMGIPERFGGRAYYGRSEFNEAGKETTKIDKMFSKLDGQAKRLFAQQARKRIGPYDPDLSVSIDQDLERFRSLSNSYVQVLDTSLDAALELEVLIQKVKKISELMHHLYERLKLLPYRDSPYLHESYRQDLLPSFQRAVGELLKEKKE